MTHFLRRLGSVIFACLSEYKKVEFVTSLSAEIIHRFSPRNPTMRLFSGVLFVQLLLGLLGGWVNSDPVPLPRSLAHRSPEEFARLYRPFLRFDGSADSFCYPDEVNHSKHDLLLLTSSNPGHK